MSSELELISQKAFEVRKKLDGPLRTGKFARFPDGCCRDASYELALVLAEAGVRKSCLVSGESSDTKINYSTHAWLEVGEIIVDITGDQFNSRLELQRPAVFVSTDRSWHQGTFDRMQRTSWSNEDKKFM